MTDYEKRRIETIPRREFLARSALGGAALLGADKLACGAEGVGAANVAEEQLGEFDPAAPSNALVTGIDPDEMVLFAFDDHWISLRGELDIRLEEPSLHENNPVLRRGEPDALWAAFYGTVFYLDGKFRMWYSAVFDRQDMKRRINMRLAYAESDDGVHWIKPKLGLREFRGSSDNNLCALNRECYNCQVLYEPEEPRPERRFKMIYTGYHHRGLDKPRLCVAYSPDGLRWVDHPKNPVVRTIFTETGGLYRWKGIYYANGQTLYPQQNGKRTMVSFASANLDSWQEAGIMSFHRPESKLGIHRGRQVHVGASIWHRRNVLLGLYGQWVGPARAIYIPTCG